MNKFVVKNINSLNEDHRITHKSGVTPPSWLTDRTDRTDRTDSHILTFSVGSQGPGHGS